jgi:hypothetical protein
MNPKRIIIKSCLCLMLGMMAMSGSAQDSILFRRLETKKGNWADLNVDNLGNFYLLSKDNRLKKINSRGDSVGAFNEVRRYGKLYSMDVTNPLKTLLYYRNFSTIIVLDRFMNIINSIDLRRQQIFQVKAIAQSYDNQIWLYDEQNNKLKKIAEDGTMLMETIDLRTIFDEVPSPEKIIDQGGYVYLYDPAKGMYVFDIYGSFKNKVSYLGLKDVHVIGQTMIGTANSELLFYTFGTLQEKRYPLPDSPADFNQKVIVTKGHLYLLRKDEWVHYTF